MNHRDTEAPRKEKDDKDPLTSKVIGIAIEIHRALGPGLLESAYEACLCHDLREAGFVINNQVPLPVVYKDVRLDCGYRLDIVVNNELILELKAIDKILPIHEAQLLTYLKLTGIKKGLILNFNTPVLKNGIKRLVT